MTQARFSIDEERFSGWLDKVAGRDNDIELLEELDITDDWDPMEPGEQTTVGGLVAEAQRHDDRHPQIGRVIAAPGRWTVAFEHADDSDGGGYYWLVRLGGSYPLLCLASEFRQMRTLAPGGLAGRAAAESIVREAAQSANDCLDAMDSYAGSRQRRSPLPGDNDTVQNLIAKARKSRARAADFDDDASTTRAWKRRSSSSSSRSARNASASSSRACAERRRHNTDAAALAARARIRPRPGVAPSPCPRDGRP